MKKNKIYIEVKPSHYAPAQILHAIAKEGIKKATLLGVADSKMVMFYRPPSFKDVVRFARSFDPGLVFTPSNADKPELNRRAFEILGEPTRTIEFDFQPDSYLYITPDNVKGIKQIVESYRIDIGLLASWLDGVGEQGSILVNNDGWLVNIDKTDRFTNESSDERRKTELTEFGGIRKPKYYAIRAKDKAFFESLRVRHEELSEILHEIDRFLPRQNRRKRGVFWTEQETGDLLSDDILELTKPDYVVEPCVGGGSLIKEMVGKVKGAMNDIDPVHIGNCEKIFEGYDWKFTNLDIVAASSDTLLSAWEVPMDRRILLYTNPPFGTTATNQMVSKKLELEGKKSRKQLILYPPDLIKYGKGDLILPIAGRLIELAKIHRNASIALFSPLSLFTMSTRYLKLLESLLTQFKFMKGYIFAGDKFHDINKTIPVALSVWEYQNDNEFAYEHSNPFDRLLDMTLEYKEKDGKTRNIGFKKASLLKDGWRYDRRGKDHLTGEIVVQHCENFVAPAPKIFHMNPRQGGSEVIPQNVKKPLGIPNIPDELAYALWGISVTLKAFGTSLSTPMYPIYMGRAYTHMPDFSNEITLEILAYAALYSVFENYAPNKIGFIGASKVFKFGGERLTEGVKYLFEKYAGLRVYDDVTLERVLHDIKESKPDKRNARRGIRDQVNERLNEIGYWDYIPIPY